MYCPYCGKELKTEGSFCPYCGRALDDEDDKGQKDECRSGENRQWFYVCGSDRTGPVSLEEIKQLIGKGYIKRDTCVWSYMVHSIRINQCCVCVIVRKVLLISTKMANLKETEENCLL